MTEVVVVLRLKSGEDILGIMVGDKNNTIILDNPYYAKYSMHTGNVSMMPYCPLSDETLFTFSKDNLEFLVVAAPSVATKFLNLIEYFQNVNEKELSSVLDDIVESEPEASSSFTTSGNDTKH